MDLLGKKLLEEKLVSEKEIEVALERQRRHGGRLGDNLVALGLVSEEKLANLFKRYPPSPTDMEDTGLDPSFITALVTKHIVLLGEFKLADVAERIKLPISVVNKVIDGLKKEKLVEIKGGTSYATESFTFKVTDLGLKQGNELLKLCRYAGPAPVTLEAYRDLVELQTVKSISVSENSLKSAFSHMVLGDHVMKRLGPAITSGKAVFIYGPSGNGKTSIAAAIGGLMSDTVYVPYAITVGGEIITVFDPVNHAQVEPEMISPDVDQRWVRVRRPVVMAGGELTLRMLDLDFNPIPKFYEASLQMKANNGVFIADDFGRQQIEPHRILNRWIVPLDRRIDYMSLHTGMKFVIPFDMLVVFCTNLDPKELVDEAFMRRIPYKIRVDPPSQEEFEVIFKVVCESNRINYKKDVFEYLLDRYYRRTGRSLTACHPRDIVEHIVIISRYYRHPPELTRESIDAACLNYFVEI